MDNKRPTTSDSKGKDSATQHLLLPYLLLGVGPKTQTRKNVSDSLIPPTPSITHPQALLLKSLNLFPPWVNPSLPTLQTQFLRYPSSLKAPIFPPNNQGYEVIAGPSGLRHQR